MEELRKEAQYKLAVRPPRLPRLATQKIVNRLLEVSGDGEALESALELQRLREQEAQR
jgi:hypothetical protein